MRPKLVMAERKGAGFSFCDEKDSYSSSTVMRWSMASSTLLISGGRALGVRRRGKTVLG